MGFKTGWVRYGERLGYLAFPELAKGPLPGIVVLQEAWGVDAHLRDVTERFAKAGYVALAPDLYAKDGERPPALTEPRIAETQRFLNGHPPAVWSDQALRDAAFAKEGAEVGARIRESFGTIMGGLSPTRFLPDALDAATYLRETCELSKGAKVGTVGFCLGGGVSGLAAAHDPRLAGAVVFYGSHLSDDQLPNVRCPLLVFHGGLDKRLADGVPAYEAKLRAAGLAFELHLYEGAQHAFFNDNRPSYSVTAARDAFVRTLAFFQKQLG